MPWLYQYYKGLSHKIKPTFKSLIYLPLGHPEGRISKLLALYTPKYFDHSLVYLLVITIAHIALVMQIMKIPPIKSLSQG